MAVESLKTLRRRVRSIKNIKQITRAMEMVSDSKLRRAQATLLAGRPYAAKLREMLANLASGGELREHPLFARREGPRKILVLFTSDRGLAGSFNNNIIKQAEERLKSEPQTQWQLFCVGRKGRDYFARRRWPILDSVVGQRGQPDVAVARRIATTLIERFLANQCDSVTLLYSAYVSSVFYRTTFLQYLPIDPKSFEAPAGGAGPAARTRLDYLFDPSAEAVFEALLPRLLASQTYITMAEVATSEHSARMIAMNNATKNCLEMGDALTLKMNKARQAAITKELLDIVGGANALKG
jgi:F-type H+-transporting ATPase subunit gamma